MKIKNEKQKNDNIFFKILRWFYNIFIKILRSFHFIFVSLLLSLVLFISPLVAALGEILSDTIKMILLYSIKVSIIFLTIYIIYKKFF